MTLYSPSKSNLHTRGAIFLLARLPWQPDHGTSASKGLGTSFYALFFPVTVVPHKQRDFPRILSILHVVIYLLYIRNKPKNTAIPLEDGSKGQERHITGYCLTSIPCSLIFRKVQFPIADPTTRSSPQLVPASGSF